MAYFLGASPWRPLRSARLPFRPFDACTPSVHDMREDLATRSARAAPDGEAASDPDDDTPEWAKDLAIDENGDLIDTKTGKALNEFGATRFDVAVRAMRGEYDPPGVSTEMEQGQIYDTHAVPHVVHISRLPGRRANSTRTVSRTSRGSSWRSAGAAWRIRRSRSNRVEAVESLSLCG